MRVALTGASGFIGTAAARALRRSGHEVTALIRPTSCSDHLVSSVSRYVRGDQSDPAIWEDLLEGAEALVHNSVDWEALRAAEPGWKGGGRTGGSHAGTGDDGEALRRHLESNLIGSIGLIAAARRAGARRVVFVSSVATHHDILSRWGGVIDEDHPLRPSSLYGAYKAAVEAHLWAAHLGAGMHTVSLRPAGVYGVEPVRLERSHGYRQVKRLREGGRVSAADFPGGGKWVHVEDVALAIVRAVERDGAAGRAFNLADCYAKHTRFAEHAAELMGLAKDRVTPDTGPPAKNAFDKSATREILGVALDRGDAGLREHVRELIAAIGEREQ